VVVLVLGFVGFRLLAPHPYAGTVMQAPTEAPSLDGLVSTDGRPVDLAAFRGDVVLLFFGYTSCPDVCPTTLTMVRRALEHLGGDAERVHVMLVSVDPERDDVGRLRDYVQSFDPSFLGATGDLDAVERAAATYGVFFSRGEAVGEGYTVDHTATLMAIDTEGHLRVVWPPDVRPDDLASDLRELL
jgi:protein SCO1/2